MFEDVADKEYAVNGRSAAGLVHLYLLLSQARPAVGRTTGARSAWGIPMLWVTIECSWRVLRTCLGQIWDWFQQLRGRWTTEVLKDRDQYAEKRRERQQTPQRVDEDSVFMGDLVGQKNARLRLEVEDAGDTDAGADDAQAHQMVFEVILREIDNVVAAADRREHRDRRQGQFLKDTRRVQHPDQRWA